MENTFERFDEYRIRRLQQGERIESFDCCDADLNDFIINESHYYRDALIAVTYVYEHSETGEILAYFSLANDKVSVADFGSKTEFNRFRRHRFVNEKHTTDGEAYNGENAAFSDYRPMFVAFTVNKDVATGLPLEAPYDYTLPFWDGMCINKRTNLSVTRKFCAGMLNL